MSNLYLFCTLCFDCYFNRCRLCRDGNFVDEACFVQTRKWSKERIWFRPWTCSIKSRYSEASPSLVSPRHEAPPVVDWEAVLRNTIHLLNRMIMRFPVKGELTNNISLESSNFGQLQLYKEYLRVIGWVGGSLISNFKRGREDSGSNIIFTKPWKVRSSVFGDVFPCTEVDSIYNTQLLVHSRSKRVLIRL